jgi:SWI/SNF-related matrix-associated actin-dependent regulator 1 of chromatin subfamily A
MSPSRRLINPMAPPGTYLFAPQPVRRQPVVDLTSDDPPVEADSDEEVTTRSNIPMSRLERLPRVEETPPKPTFGMDLSSSFSYGSNNRKRPAENSYSFPQNKRFQAGPRQAGPARAMPPPIHSLSDIPDAIIRRDVARMTSVLPNRSINDLYHILSLKRGNYQDALDFALDMDADADGDQGLLPSPKFNGIARGVAQSTAPAPLPRKTAQRGLTGPTQRLRDNFSHLQKAQVRTAPAPSPTTSSPQPPKKKGRLVRGRRNPSPESQPILHIESDEDEGIQIISDNSSEAGVSEEPQVDKASLLKFFNTCTVEAMVDLSSQKEEDVRTILDQRPFRSLAQVEKMHVGQPDTGKKKARRPKTPFGEKLVESAMTMWTGFEAIDQLVKKCTDLGKPIAATMATWGVDVFGASKDGELDLTSLDDSSDTNSMRDSGVGTPRSHTSDTEVESLGQRRVLAKRKPSSKPELLKKPDVMRADVELKDYQVVGLNWLNLLWKEGVSGILADDMGLGKTCQVIAFLSHLKSTGVSGPHLIVVPGSTIANWLREIERFSTLHAEPYHGSQKERAEMQEAILSDLASEMQTDIIVTTYDIANKREDNRFLRKCRPQACVFDEGHVLRNSNTKRYQELMRINCKWRLLLTGTPLQNSLRELTSILAFIMPDIFKEVEDDLAIVFKLKAKVNETDTHGHLLSTQRTQRARSMMTPFVLRRKKAQVLKHLPKKTSRVEYCELTESQTKLYSAQLEKQKRVLLDRAAGIPSKEHANVMMKLRQAAIHPLLFRDRYNDDVIRKMAKACLKEPTFENSNPDVIFEDDLQWYSDFSCHQLAERYPRALGKFALTNEEWMDSGKVKKLAELLKKYKENGDRTLIFSQFTSVMDILQLVLDTLDVSYSRIDGSTDIRDRQPLLDQFYEDESISVFMLSTKSGGAGINLACANKVIIFDSSFNPQDDVQAENRAHRVGQTREVEVVRLVTKGTVEEQIYALGVSKLELDKMVAGEESTVEAKAAGNKLSAAEEMGVEAVEKMMLEQLKKEKSGDIKDEFLGGLKAAGLDMSAAE